MLRKTIFILALMAIAYGTASAAGSEPASHVVLNMPVAAKLAGAVSFSGVLR